MTNYDYDFYVGDHQVAVVDVDEGSEGGKSLDFYKKPSSFLWPCAPTLSILISQLIGPFKIFRSSIKKFITLILF